MRILREGIHRLWGTLRRGRRDDELEQELRLHLELAAEDARRRGDTPEEAARAARIRAGGVPPAMDALRDQRSLVWCEHAMQDVRYGTRLLWRSPSFTAVAVLSLALGIGSTAALFNIADAVLFRSLAVKAPRELHEVRATMSLGAATKVVSSVSEDTLDAMQRGADFAELVGFRTLDDGRLAGVGPMRVELVTGNYFEVLGVTPAAGRLLTGSDVGSGQVPIVISERVWRSWFAADPNIGGRPATLNDASAVVIGVARAFRGLLAERPADVMVPAAAGRLIDPATAASGLRLVARLRAGVSTPVAEQRMAALYWDVISKDPLLRGGEVRVTLPDASRGASDARESLQRPVVLGLALVGVLLAVACANTGGLLLARLTSRSGEFGVRIAIGAGRARLLRQLIVEALLLAAMAAAAGLLVARVAAPVLLRSIPLTSMPADFEVRFDWRLVAFTAAIAAVAALVAGGASLLHLRRTDTSAILTLNSRLIVRGRRRMTEILIATQVACSLLLLVAAGAMTRTLINLGRVDPGFDAGGIIAISVDATGRTADARSLPAYYARLQERIASAPQVAGVSFAQIGLMTNAATTGTVEIAGWSPAADADRWVRMFFVGPDFFETLGMPLLAGNGIGGTESASRERVAVVNRAFAEFYFGSIAGAVGRTVNRDIRIVGVTADARYTTLRDEPVRAMFVPSTQARPRTGMTFIVKSAGDTSNATTAALAAIRAHDSGLKAKAATLSDQIAATLSRERFVAMLASVLSGLALFLSCGGLFATVAYAVSERHRELAVRLALGATTRDIVLVVLRGPLRITAIGLILGIPGTYAIMQAVAAFLFDVAPFDLPTIAGSGVALMALATAAALWPARRAAAIDPQECLKST